jgi:hypothetical protein
MTWGVEREEEGQALLGTPVGKWLGRKETVRGKWKTSRAGERTILI